MRAPARPRPATCPDCGGPPGVQSPSGRCYPCAARRREALHRIVKLRPIADRLAGVLSSMQRITSVAEADDQAAGWRGTSYAQDFAMLRHTLTQIEDDLNTLADEWQVLLLTR